ncbi:MAG: carboxymuconolactone decarboxylase family protein [Actinomycetota bacterium]
MSSEDPAATGIFDERDMAAIVWADRVTRNEAQADPAAWTRLRDSFTQAEAVELTLAACLFNFLNRFNDTMWLELDDGAPPGAELYIEPEAFRRYAASMYERG